MSASVIRPSDTWLCAYSARTPVGLCAESAAAAVRAGLSALELQDWLVDTYDEPVRAAVDPLLTQDDPVGTRLSRLSKDALQHLFPDHVAEAPRLHILVVFAGRTPAYPIDPEDLHEVFAQPFPQASFTATFSDDGHAAGIIGLGMAARALDSGKADAVIVVGSESYCDRSTIQALDEAGDLKTEDNRNGFPPGEGAAAVLIAPGRVVRVLGLKPLAALTAVSCAIETVDPEGGAPVNGDGLSEAFAGLEPVIRESDPAITDTYCDLNGVRYRSDELMFTILRMQHLFEDAHNYIHPADCWGDVGAASGPLFTVLAAEAHKKKYSAGSRALIWASSRSGSRAAALLDFPSETSR